ncbi:hypothetical protein [Sphingomonas aerophila]|uniref:Uncharacterized protein n=1 Tax=Sphingomonas aerophila TaxID=1344948 RepID=A0A7W9BEA1_9SPHN|nr:hypothetical protein [Sphingomonas aerophila]MBB5715423.1 hypothetical protein [Sphingomonas aerophila]
MGEPATKAGDNIGVATMDADRQIVLDLGSVGCDGEILEARVVYKPTDAGYAEVLAHIGGLEPGKTKSVPAWPDEPCPDRAKQTGRR